jgi:RHS repeat-associated protein
MGAQMKRAVAILALCVGAVWSSTAWTQTSSITRNAAFLYDTNTGLLTQETIEPGSPQLQLQANTTYDAFGNKLSVTKSGYGFATRQTSATYDNLGQFVATTTNALNQTDTWQYDPVTGRLAYHLDPNYLPTSWYYDYLGRKTLEVRPDGTMTSYDYNLCAGSGNACVSNAVYYVTATPHASNYEINGPVAIVYFDSLDREVGRDTQGFDGSTVRALRQYDTSGRVAQSSRPFFAATGNPQWTVNQYDVLNRVTRSTAPDGSVTLMSYQGLTVTQTNANNQTRAVTKNARGDVIQVTDALLNNFYYARDALGNLLSTTDTYGNTVTATYDTRGRKVSSSDPDLGSWSYSYDALNELVSQTDAKSQTTTLVYDQLGRMTQRAEPDMTSAWVYDTAANGIGKLASASSTGQASGTTPYQRVYSYDEISRLSEVDTYINSTEYTFTATYDPNGRLSIVNYPSGSSVQYSYNWLGYANQLSDAYSGNALWTLNSLDAEQHITQETAGNGVVTNQSFSFTNGRLLTIQASNGTGNNTVQNLSFWYDSLGNLTSREDFNETFTENFLYDQLNRLTQASISTNVYQTKILTYDAVGDILSKSDVGNYTYPTGGQGVVQPHAVLSTSGGALTTTFSYDANGNRTSTHDANGNQTSGINWTSFNKPESISQGTQTISFLHGPDHQRFMQTTPQGNTLYFDCFGVHAELAPGNMWNDYFAIGNVLVGERVTNAATEAVTASYYFHTDHLGSISVITNQQGAVVQRLSYDAWGKTRLPNGQDGQPPASDTTRGFTGQEELTVSGLVHLNGRVYDPTFGRMTSADPTVPDPLDPQAFNRYSYVGNDPLTFTDPSGFSWLSSFFNEASTFFRAVLANPIARAVTQIAIAAILTAFGQPGVGALILSAAASGAIVTGLSGGNLSQMIRASISAAVITGEFYGAGQLMAPTAAAFGQPVAYAANIAEHGAIACFSSVVSGGSCGSGALSGAASAGLAPVASQAGYFGGAAISGLAGGLLSVAGGGKFENGAVTAAFGYLFNTCQHVTCTQAEIESGAEGGTYDPTSPYLEDALLTLGAVRLGGLVYGAYTSVVEFFTAAAVPTIAEATATLPEGMTVAQFGRLAGFSQGLEASSAASVEASPEVIANLKAGGVSADAISTFQRFYAGAAADNPGNLSAIQRAALLGNILKGY